MSLRRLVSLTALAASAALAPEAAAGTLFVNANLSTGANNGASWADAFQGSDGVRAALAAAIAGDEVWVAAGTYKPTQTATRTIAFQLKNGVAVYGGFLGTETAVSQRAAFWTVESILSADLNGDDGSNVLTDNSVHVLTGAGTNATAVLDGFIARGGNANMANPNDRGGGILCTAGASPTIRNTRFVSNRCTFGGGAGYINGATSAPSFTNCTFENGVGGSFGGAFDMATVGAVTFDRCLFFGNSAARAGALEIFSTANAVRVLNCVFRNNTATGTGSGGAIWISGSNPQIRNCTIVSNTSTAGAAAGINVTSGSPTIANCIVWQNTGSGGAMGPVNQVSPISANVTYSIVTGGFTGTGNLSSDPQFTNAGAFNYRPLLSSPAIDAGNTASMPSGFNLDIGGGQRFTDELTVPDTGVGGPPVIDIGAFELPAPSTTLFCFGDGFGTPCPCGNNSPFSNDEGCINSLALGGKLRASGIARINTDSLVLTGSQMPNSSALYFQGTTQQGGGAGVAFGDGLRCAGGQVIRLGTKTNAGGGSQYPDVGDPSVSVRGQVTLPASVRTYQVWYRNAAAFCQAETFNLTNGVEVRWEL